MGTGDSLSEWQVTDHLLRLGVLLFAAISILTLVRKRVGGASISYTTMVCGVTFLIMGEVLWLADPLAPDWGLRDADVDLPVYSGGYLLVLAGFLALMRDIRRGQVGDRQTASDERARAEASRLQEERLQVALDELKRVQATLRHERDFVRGILETNEVVILSTELEDGRLVVFNKGAEHLTGYSREEVIGRPFREVLLAPEDRAAMVQWREDILAGRRSPVGGLEQFVVTKSGERRLISWKYTVCHDEQARPTHLAAFGSDITRQREMQERLEQAKADLERANAELERLAATDYLTGLVNRRLAATLFEHEMVRSRRGGSPLAVILLDLDRFKAINDTHGHEAGDAVLKDVAQTLKGRLRATDIVARYGGDEFLLVLPDTGREGAAFLAEEIRQLVQRTPIRHGEVQLTMTSSLGLAVAAPGQFLSIDELVRRADEAMYRAKKLGGNRVATWDSPVEAEVAPGLVTGAG